MVTNSLSLSANTMARSESNSYLALSCTVEALESTAFVAFVLLSCPHPNKEGIMSELRYTDINSATIDRWVSEGWE